MLVRIISSELILCAIDRAEMQMHADIQATRAFVALQLQALRLQWTRTTHRSKREVRCVFVVVEVGD